MPPCFLPDRGVGGWPWLGELFVTVASVVALNKLFIHYLVFQHLSRSPPPEEDDDVDPPATRLTRFHEQLPDTVSRDVVHLRMRDHYVEVHTTGGSCLVLMRFADAIAELGTEGMRVHRSYWAAHRHVVGIVRRRDRALLRVTGDHLLPVSRSRLAAVQETMRGGSDRAAVGRRVGLGTEGQDSASAGGRLRSGRASDWSATVRLFTTAGLWRLTYRHMLVPATLGLVTAITALFVLVTSIFAPLGTAGLGFGTRLAYWAASAAIATPVCYSTTVINLYLLRFRSLIDMAPGMGVSLIVQSLVCTAVVQTVDTLFFPDRVGSWDWLWEIFQTVVIVVAIAVFFVHHVVLQYVSEAQPPSGTPDPTTRLTRFHERLPDTVSRDVVHLRMSDHYVEVHTTGGSCLVLTRFADAIAELGAEGMQVHRSFWAAHRHMVATVRERNRTLLRLTNGRLLPVSRNRVAAVQAALAAAHARRGGPGLPR